MSKATTSMGIDAFEQAYVRPRAGRTLIAGSRVFGSKEDRRKRYETVVGVDMEPGEGVDFVLDLEEPLPESIGTFAHIECMSVLEHSKRPWLLAANLEKVLEPGGTIYVSVPTTWKNHGYPSDLWRLLPPALDVIFPNVEWVTKAAVTDNAIYEEWPKHFPAIKKDDRIYLERMETCGFGVKR